ncbi:hypothetical protein QAD02_003041 [Eretmocerus hayati]|uniref:Uncharacterized protein n=1 Tax=Eretmocerus hayati TaxID=131215 RepID=A0ACC2NL13_9HYME|nr:hypothetical protein QAD02_003041 [Eretmocerus hayati]
MADKSNEGTKKKVIVCKQQKIYMAKFMKLHPDLAFTFPDGILYKELEAQLHKLGPVRNFNDWKKSWFQYLAYAKDPTRTHIEEHHSIIKQMLHKIYQDRSPKNPDQQNQENVLGVSPRKRPPSALCSFTSPSKLQAMCDTTNLSSQDPPSSQQNNHSTDSSEKNKQDEPAPLPRAIEFGLLNDAQQTQEVDITFESLSKYGLDNALALAVTQEEEPNNAHAATEWSKMDTAGRVQKAKKLLDKFEQNQKGKTSPLNARVSKFVQELTEIVKKSGDDVMFFCESKFDDMLNKVCTQDDLKTLKKEIIHKIEESRQPAMDSVKQLISDEFKSLRSWTEETHRHFMDQVRELIDCSAKKAFEEALTKGIMT